MTVIATAVRPPLLGEPGRHRPRGSDLHPRHPARPARRSTRTPDELYFITGADALAQLLTWRDVDELFALAHFVGVTRPGHVAGRPGAAHRRGEPRRGPRAGHLLHRRPRRGCRRASDRLPGARGRRALRRQARALPAGRRVSPDRRHGVAPRGSRAPPRAQACSANPATVSRWRTGSRGGKTPAQPGSATVLPGAPKPPTVQPPSRQAAAPSSARSSDGRRVSGGSSPGWPWLAVVVLGVLLVVCASPVAVTTTQHRHGRPDAPNAR